MSGSIDLTITEVGIGGALIRLTGRGVYNAPRIASKYGADERAGSKAARAAYRLEQGEVAVDVGALRKIGEELANKIRKSASQGLDELAASGEDIERIVIEGEEKFHRVPWELLTFSTDSQLRDVGIMRTPLDGRHHFDVEPHEDELRVLLVTARPFGHGDAGGQRSVLGPILNDTFYGKDSPPRVDVLRGGSFDLLLDRLRDQKRSGSPYHILHLDMHGALQDKDKGGSSAEIYFETIDSAVPDHREGMKESARICADARTVPELAEALRPFGIEAVVFNSCNSASGSSQGETDNMALHLVQSGIPAAIGMRRVVSVEGASLFCRELYEKLAQSASLDNPLTNAVAMARQAMRRAARDGRLRLDESGLPVLYLSRSPRLRFGAPNIAAQAGHRAQQARTLRWIQELARRAPHSVHGRDLDERIIRELLFGHTGHFRQTPRATPTNEVRTIALTGMAGAGKTTLLHELALYWDRANYVNRSVRLDTADLLKGVKSQKSFTGKQATELVEGWILRSLQISGDVSQDASYDQVTEMIDAPEETLIVIDAGDRLEHEIAKAVELFLLTLHNNRNWVLIGGREVPAWISSVVPYAQFRMEGLDPAAAWQLMTTIRGGLASHEAAAAERLATALHNLPGAMVSLLTPREKGGSGDLVSLHKELLAGKAGLFPAESAVLESICGASSRSRTMAKTEMMRWAMFVGLDGDIAESILIGHEGDKRYLAGRKTLQRLREAGLAEANLCTDESKVRTQVWTLHPAVPHFASTQLTSKSSKSRLRKEWGELAAATTAQLVVRPWGTTATALLHKL